MLYMYDMFLVLLKILSATEYLKAPCIISRDISGGIRACAEVRLIKSAIFLSPLNTRNFPSKKVIHLRMVRLCNWFIFKCR